MSGLPIASIKPLWRFAVALEHRPDLPAIPYYTRAAAETFAATSRAELPNGDRTVVLKRVGWRTVA